MSANSEVRNERAKLSAKYVNNIALALFVVGGLTPLATAFQEGSVPPVLVTTISGVCLSASVALHFLARWLLRNLVPS